MTIRTRMAPSPTGDMHVGSLATALKNYAYAKKHGGEFILRIEDTDKTREVENGVQAIQDILHAYGLDWDEGPIKGGPHTPYIQSERLSIYQQKAKELVKDGKAYYCFCSKERLEELKSEQMNNKQLPKYDQHCRNLSEEEVREKLAKNFPFVIRLAVPENLNLEFTDLIRGKISFSSSDIDDQVLLKSDGYPTYHLAVVVDDHDMQITHIVRGEEWISSTPKHLLLYQAFGWPNPVYAHIPVFLNPDGKGKMSKRKGEVSAQSFLDKGYLPEAMLNFFMILGWTPQDQREILTLEEYIKEYDPVDQSAKSIVFDLKKLDWMNGMYIRKMSLGELEERIQPFLPNDFPLEKLDQILPLVFERLFKLGEIEELTTFFYRDIEVDSSALLKKSTSEVVANQLQATLESLANIDWNLADIEQTMRKVQEIHDWKKSQYFMMIRVAVTGRQATPPLFETMEVIGKDEVINRLENARDKIKKTVNSQSHL